MYVIYLFVSHFLLKWSRVTYENTCNTTRFKETRWNRTQIIQWRWAKIIPQRTCHKVLSHDLLEGSKFSSELYRGWNKAGNMITTKFYKHFPGLSFLTFTDMPNRCVSPASGRRQWFFRSCWGAGDYVEESLSVLPEGENCYWLLDVWLPL